MSTHFSIGFERPYEEMVPQILDRARSEPQIVHIDLVSRHLLIFAYSAEAATEARARYQQDGSVSPSLCVVTINRYELNGTSRYAIVVNRECGEESEEVMIPFMTWVLTGLGPCRVVDNDTGEDLSELAAHHPEQILMD